MQGTVATKFLNQSRSCTCFVKQCSCKDCLFVYNAYYMLQSWRVCIKRGKKNEVKTLTAIVGMEWVAVSKLRSGSDAVNISPPLQWSIVCVSSIGTGTDSFKLTFFFPSTWCSLTSMPLWHKHIHTKYFFPPSCSYLGWHSELCPSCQFQVSRDWPQPKLSRFETNWKRTYLKQTQFRILPPKISLTNLCANLVLKILNINCVCHVFCSAYTSAASWELRQQCLYITRK